MSTTAAATSGSNMSSKCGRRMPPMTSIVIITSARHIVTDMLGSSIMSAHSAPPTAARGSQPLTVVIFS